MGIQVCLISGMNFDYKENGRKKKLFFQIQHINIVYPNGKNMVIGPITKWMEIIVGIQVSLISWMNFNYMKIAKRKVFLANLKHQYRAS